MPQGLFLAFDVGSVSLKTALLDASGAILWEDYRRTNGRPFWVALDALRELRGRVADEDVAAFAVTGSGGAWLAETLGGVFINEVIAWSRGISRFAPQARTAIEMGGEDSKLLLFEPDAKNPGVPRLQDFSMNSLCAAGTGSFLDQQATRLGLSIENEFGEMALRSEHAPRIAGRCSVFAKSDMIHLQQVATPVHEIAMGLCLALARSFKSTVGRGKDFVAPIAFMGGVASNAAMVRAFEEVLGLKRGELIIPERHRTMGAIGAAFSLIEDGVRTEFRGLEVLEARLGERVQAEVEGQKPLRDYLTPLGDPEMDVVPLPEGNDKVEVYIGVDIGSVSTNVVAIDRENRVLSKRYLWTASRPIEAVKRGLEEVCAEIGDRVVVRGAGTTGSGRYLIGELIGADVIRNEITAQATAAIMIDPEVDTIFEIGGQDSKYISVDQGTVCDFEMNKACAAGTGSFLSEQAERLGIDLKLDFSRLALDAERPVGLGDRCTVFMESDLIHHQQRGASTPDLLAGLAYSIVHNYLNRVVGDRRIGERIFFQGGTAFNKSVVAAFNSVLGKEIVVPPHHEMTGAIGVAMLARDKTVGESRFRGFDFSKIPYEVRSFTCRECDNLCEIRQVRMDGRPPLYFGSRCEKYEVDRHAKESNDLPDLFAEREALFLAEAERKTPAPQVAKGRVGIPLTLSFLEVLPFWRTFFQNLGFEVVLSTATNRVIVGKGVESVVSETCFPVKVAHGHVLELLEREDLDMVFLPSLIDSATEDFGPKDRTVFNCPLIQAIPYTSRSAIDYDSFKTKVYSPALHMQWGLKAVGDRLSQDSAQLKSGARDIRAALEAAQACQDAFLAKLKARGKEVLDKLDGSYPALAIVARPYNGCDLGMNLDLPRKIRSLGALPIPMDMLPLDEKPLSKRWRKVYWRYGQKIMKAADYVRNHPHLFAVYITNFSCGPDSFILEFFRKEMSPKPYLTLEIDEHSADAGLITRCEAFLDTLENVRRRGVRPAPVEAPALVQTYTNHRRIYVPNMAPHAHGLSAAFRSVGVESEVMPLPDLESVHLGERYTSGRECYPCLLTTGDMVRQTRRPDFDPSKSAFFMAAADGPCRFGQYNRLQREVLDQLGLNEVPIFTLEQGDEYRKVMSSLGARFERRAWLGIAAVDIMERLLLEKRPVEKSPGATEAWFDKSLKRVCDTMANDTKNFFEALRQAAEDYRGVEANDEPDRPLVGVVGEVYVRANTFANQDLIRQIEALGGRAVVPTMGEWIRYTRLLRADWNRVWGHYGRLIMDGISNHVLEADERRVYRAFGRVADPSPRGLFELAEPYLDKSFEGETILTVGKSIELIRHEGARGIVNTMPFTCMPGAICSALLKRVREDHDDIPMLSMSYTVQQSGNNQSRLEAFMYQVREYRPAAGAARASHA